MIKETRVFKKDKLLNVCCALLPLIFVTLIFSYLMINERVAAASSAAAGVQDGGNSKNTGVNVQKLLEKTLDSMVSSYRNKNIAKFMENVADDFVGDSTMLQIAVQKDFSFVMVSDMYYTVAGCSVSSGETDRKVSATVRFNRSLISVRNGRSFTDHALTEFVFRLTDDGQSLLLYSCKLPLIFGLSNGDVATGAVRSAENRQVIQMDEQGNLFIGVL